MTKDYLTKTRALRHVRRVRRMTDLLGRLCYRAEYRLGWTSYTTERDHDEAGLPSELFELAQEAEYGERAYRAGHRELERFLRPTRGQPVGVGTETTGLKVVVGRLALDLTTFELGAPVKPALKPRTKPVMDFGDWKMTS
jgi:hypothetical protein